MASVIGVYEYLSYDEVSNVYHPYDERFPDVARRAADMIQRRMPAARVEHVGSTAIPGCAGKGIIDLLLTYEPGSLEEARDTLDALGFQRQRGPDPFPEERPMRLGTLEHDGKTFRLHVHVISTDSPEAAELIYFRDRLRADPALVEEYMASKRAAFTNGQTNNIDYNRAKRPFMSRVLGRDVEA